jgi:hypothetical protein
MLAGLLSRLAAADTQLMIPTKSNRRWITARAGAAWGVTLAAMTVGGAVAWIALGTGLCEDDGSAGSDAFCNRGGWEASGLALGALVVLAVLIPAVGLAAGKRRLFWIGLLSPVALGVLVVVLAAVLGTD